MRYLQTFLRMKMRCPARDERMKTYQTVSNSLK